jgi:hypothetical protein
MIASCQSFAVLCELAFNVSFFLERIHCAKLAKYRKARGGVE